MILLISISVFLTLSAIVLLVYQLATAQQRQVAARLEQVARGGRLSLQRLPPIRRRNRPVSGVCCAVSAAIWNRPAGTCR